ncbi:hypothetical protein PHET_00649 [Paragonimus heterotremus]|uniref:Uncharacterized protein n=1 Tax=Paragonimus heterotremus TaxID=100268 RepID=A0A8J4X3I6_9TREM|nr:hypothetical protein PHET_00649 [Paragonimus heterotremus]
MVFCFARLLTVVGSLGFCCSLFAALTLILIGTWDLIWMSCVGIFLFLFCLCASFYTVYYGRNYPKLSKATIDYFSGSVSYFCFKPSRLNVLYNTTVVTYLLWYVTMLVPVNIEDKLLVWEIIFYHILLIVIIVTLNRVRSYNDQIPEASVHVSIESGKSSGVDDIGRFGTHHADAKVFERISNMWHCHWIDLWITANSRLWFVALLSAHLVFAVYTANLALTSVCTPRMYLDWFILPSDCSSVYADYGRAWIFTASVYWLITAVVPLIMLAHQLAIFLRLIHPESMQKTSCAPTV